MFLHVLNGEKEKRAFIELAHSIANANGIIDESEKAVMDMYNIEMKTNYALDEFQGLALNQIVDSFESDQAKKAVFLEAIALAFADQIYDKEEEKKINDLREAFGFTVEYYQEVKQWIIDFNKLFAEGNRLINQ